MCFHVLYTVQVDTVSQKALYISGLSLFLRYGIQKTKKHILHKWGFIVLYSKEILYLCFTQIIFWSKNLIFLYILKIFFTMLHLKIFLEYWIILYIFRISLCVTSPLYILKIYFTMLHLKIFLEYWIILHIFRISLCLTSHLKLGLL